MSPLERAMQSIDSKVEEIYAFEKLPTNLDLARSVLESIDTNQLADLIYQHYARSDGLDVVAHETAHAVKTWLTGKETQ